MSASAALVAGLAFAAAPLAAQVTLTADATLASGYVWRGVTFTNRPVVQPDLVLSAPVAGATVTLGGWANAEPARYTAPSAMSLDGGRPAVTATTFWADATRGVGGGRSRVDLTAGTTAYWYPPITGLGATYNSVELYGRAGFAGPLAPKLAVYVDVARVRGAYAEGAVAHAFPVSRRLALTLSGTSGVSLGQAADASGRDAAYFAHDGLAFADVGLGVTATLGAVGVAPTAHLVFARDGATRVTSPGASQARKLWVGGTVTWARTVRPARAEAAR